MFECVDVLVARCAQEEEMTTIPRPTSLWCCKKSSCSVNCQEVKSNSIVAIFTHLSQTMGYMLGVESRLGQSEPKQDKIYKKEERTCFLTYTQRADLFQCRVIM